MNSKFFFCLFSSFNIQFSFFRFIFSNLSLTLNIYVPNGLYLKLSPFADVNTAYNKPVTYTVTVCRLMEFCNSDFGNIMPYHCLNNWAFYYAWTLVAVLYSESRVGLSQNSSQGSGAQSINVCSEGLSLSLLHS